MIAGQSQSISQRILYSRLASAILKPATRLCQPYLKRNKTQTIRRNVIPRKSDVDVPLPIHGQRDATYGYGSFVGNRVSRVTVCAPEGIILEMNQKSAILNLPSTTCYPIHNPKKSVAFRYCSPLPDVSCSLFRPERL